MYFHFGLSSAIQLLVLFSSANIRHYILNSSSNVDVIKVVIGINGISIAKSSSSQLWPILGYIRPCHDCVFPIGI